MARPLTCLLVGTALFVCSCQGTGSDDGLSLQLFGDAEELAVYRTLADAYEEETGEKVELVEVPDRESHLQKLSTSFAAGDPPAVFLINYRNYGRYAARGVLKPVEPLLERSLDLSAGDFYPVAMEAFTYEGELQCMPQNISSLVVYYNRDLFQEAGVPEPSDDWTFRQMLRAGQRLLDPPRSLGVGIEPDIVRAAPFVWAAGGELVDDYSNPTRFTLTTEAARAGLQNFLDLADVGPTEIEARGTALDERFLDGELAMFLGSRREVPTLRTIEAFDWDVAPFPRFRERVGLLHSDAYCIAEGSAAGAAWRFVEFAVGPEGSRITAEGGRTVPSLKSVAASDAFLDPAAKPRRSKVFLEAIPHIRRLPSSPDWARLEDAAYYAFEEPFYKNGTPDQIVERLERETDGLFDAADR